MLCIFETLSLLELFKPPHKISCNLITVNWIISYQGLISEVIKIEQAELGVPHSRI